MAWRYNGIRVYADKYDTKTERNIARLNPLSGSTILHMFGTDSEIINFGGLVATDSDMDALKALVSTSSSYTLSGPEGIIGDYYLKGLKAGRTPITFICLFDRPAVSGNAPVYDVEMELYLDS